MSENTLRKFWWKGKRVTEKVYKDRIRMVEAGKQLRERRRQNNVLSNIKTVVAKNLSGSAISNPKGRRIVHLKHLENNLICKECAAVLSLQNIVTEKQCGAASMFVVKCRNYLADNTVTTDKMHFSEKRNTHFDVNSKLLLGNYKYNFKNTIKKLVLLYLQKHNIKSHVFFFRRNSALRTRMQSY